MSTELPRFKRHVQQPVDGRREPERAPRELLSGSVRQHSASIDEEALATQFLIWYSKNAKAKGLEPPATTYVLIAQLLLLAARIANEPSVTAEELARQGIPSVESVSRVLEEVFEQLWQKTLIEIMDLAFKSKVIQISLKTRLPPKFYPLAISLAKLIGSPESTRPQAAADKGFGFW